MNGLINYKTACRNCLSSDGIPRIQVLFGDDLLFFKKSNEFEAMQKIEEWRKVKDEKCHFCGSGNIEVFDIEVNDIALYNFENLTFNAKRNDLDLIVISIDKTNFRISQSIKGRQDHKLNFFIQAYDFFIFYIKSLDDEFFIEHSEASFYACIKEDQFNHRPIIERFYCHGFSREEILSKLIETYNYVQNNNEPNPTKLHFPLITKSDFIRINNHLLNNIGKMISINITYFDEDHDSLMSFLSGDNKSEPKFLKAKINGIIAKDDLGIKILNNENSEEYYFAYRPAINIAFLLGFLRLKLAVLSEFEYDIH